MNAFINGISYYLPKKILSNDTLADLHPEWSIEKISKKTGIDKRHIAEKGETVSMMAVNAANAFFAEHEIKKTDIDFIILCTQSPDFVLPTTACILQDKIGLNKNIGAFDFNLGCSGYVYGLGIAKGLILSHQANNILLITAETYSKYIHPDDKSNKTLFGDAATVSLITNKPINTSFTAKILDFEYGTDGSGFKHLIVQNSAWESRFNKEGNEVRGEEEQFISNDNYLYMNGEEIFNFTAKEIPILVERTLKKNHHSFEDIDQYIFHQANAFMLNYIRKKCKIPQERFFVSMTDIGNTVSSTIPIALKRYVDQTEKREESILLAGFGVGLSMGGVILQTT